MLRAARAAASRAARQRSGQRYISIPPPPGFDRPSDDTPADQVELKKKMHHFPLRFSRPDPLPEEKRPRQYHDRWRPDVNENDPRAIREAQEARDEDERSAQTWSMHPRMNWGKRGYTLAYGDGSYDTGNPVGVGVVEKEPIISQQRLLQIGAVAAAGGLYWNDFEVAGMEVSPGTCVMAFVFYKFFWAPNAHAYMENMPINPGADNKWHWQSWA